MIMQMDAYLKKEQLSTLFVGGGARGGGGGGGGGPLRGVHPIKYTCHPKKAASCPGQPYVYVVQQGAVATLIQESGFAAQNLVAN